MSGEPFRVGSGPGYVGTGAYFDQEAAEVAENFFERILVHVKGEWAGRPFILEPWQRAIIRDLFGWRDETGARQYRTAYIEIPRKNGKSSLAAGIALFLLFADGEPGAEVYSAAADRNQAGIVFGLASQMVEDAEVLAEGSETYKRSIVEHENRGVYQVLSADAPTKHGLNASGIVVDELHAQPNRELVDVLITSTGARRQPLTVLLTTSGFSTETICGEFHDYAIRVRDGVIEDPTFYPVIYSASDETAGSSPKASSIKWEDETLWKQANPNLGVSVKLEYLRTQARKARNIPAYQNTFLRLHLDVWTEQETRWLSMDLWAACEVPFDESAFLGAPCYGGLDLASTRDLASLVLVFPSDPDEPEHFAALAYFWIPGDNITERVRKGRVPYDLWVQQGLIQTTEGNAIDYEFIIRDIEALFDKFAIKEIAFDRWGAFQVSQRLEALGLEVVGFGQGFRDMASPTSELNRLIENKQFRHNGNAVLGWCASNVVVSEDPAGNLKPNKQKSREKIDGIVALIMALARAIVYRESGADGSVYEKRGIISI